jgi:hypothetical protein
MPKVNSGLDPDNPEQGEYTALTEYQYTMMENGREVISTQIGQENRHPFPLKSCR